MARRASLIGAALTAFLAFALLLVPSVGASNGNAPLAQTTATATADATMMATTAATTAATTSATMMATTAATTSATMMATTGATTSATMMATSTASPGTLPNTGGTDSLPLVFIIGAAVLMMVAGGLLFVSRRDVRS